MIVFVSRDSQGFVSGIAANAGTSGCAEQIDDGDPQVVAYRAGSKRPVPLPIPSPAAGALASRQQFSVRGVGTRPVAVAAGLHRVTGQWLDRVAGGGAMADLSRGGSLSLTAGADTLSLTLSQTGDLTVAVSVGAGLHDLYLDLITM